MAGQASQGQRQLSFSTSTCARAPGG